MSEEILDELNASFVSPEREFLGDKIAPYTEGSRLLMLQIRDENDTPVWFVWSFLYIHILLHKNRKDAVRLAWNKDLFREKVLDWVANKSAKDRDDATELVGQIIQEAAKSRVEVMPNPSALPESGKA